jgi:hypothetical protein
MVIDERRRFHRLKLVKPILGQLDGKNALILDVGVAGAFIEHHGRIAPGSRVRLAFRWQGHDLEFVSEIARTKIVRPSVSHTGLRFVEPIGNSSAQLQEMMATFIGRVLAAQRANASGNRDGESILAAIGGARRSRSRGWIAYHFVDHHWTREEAVEPRQPADGFTVGAFEDEEELETLCRTYEASNEEGRELIRLVAELSALSVHPD